MTAPMVSGYGQFHTDELDAKHRKPYTSIDWAGIVALVDNPQRVPKADAQWLIASSLASRNFQRQERDGKFWLLWADLDKAPPPLQQVVDTLIHEIVGACDFEVFSSRSATVDVPKARILIPLSQPLTGSDWALTQEVLNDELQANGIQPDRASERTGQLCYLPNRGDHYKAASQRDGTRFDPLAAWADLIGAKHKALADKAAALEAARKAAKARREARAAQPGGTDGRSLIDAFNAAYDVAEILLRNGYAQRGNTFCHPGSESGSYSASVKDGRVHSLSSSDPLYTEGGDVGAHDAFSAFTMLMHDGNQDAGLRDAGDRWLMIGGESWNTVERREWAQRQQASNDQQSQGGGDDTEPDDDGDGGAPTHPLARYVDLDAEPMAPRWVIPGFIGHGLAIFAGAHGAGKTTGILPLSMTAAGLHRHGDPLAPKHWRHVAYITEDTEQALRIVAGIVKFGGLGLNAQTVRERLHIVEARRLDPAYVAEAATVYREQFSRVVDGVEVPPLVVFDTKAAVFSMEEENSNSEASAIVAMLKQSFQGLPVWLVGHVAKANLTRADMAGLTLRGASAFEADANQVLYLVRDGEERYLVRGKTRFEAMWPELRIESKTASTLARDEFGDMQQVTLRWGIAVPPQQSRKEAQERAQEAQRKADIEALREEVRDAIDVAWMTGIPLNRAGVKAKVTRRDAEVVACIESLLAERWLLEVEVPSKERTNANRARFLVNMTPHEHDGVIRGEGWPAAKLVVPESWRKPAAPSVPEPLSPGEQEVAPPRPDEELSVRSQSVRSPKPNFDPAIWSGPSIHAGFGPFLSSICTHVIWRL